LPSPIKTLVLSAALAAAVLPTAANAADDAACKAVRFADVGWSDIAASTGLAAVVLDALGYKPSNVVASIPIALDAMKNKQVDVFMGYWRPSMTPVFEPYVRAGQIQPLDTPNLVGAKYTLAVPAYLYDKGLKDFSDIARFRKELDGKIHGIEAGSDGNALIQAMIREDRFGLKDFSLVEATEAGMLAQAQAAARSRKAMVFLGWEPHPMNVQLRMRYLSGGDGVFGAPDATSVHTAVSSGYLEKCPNVARLLQNLQFTAEMESRVMEPILSKVRPQVAARSYLKKNPGVLEPWLRGVTTVDGKDGLAAVTAALQR
jgi:glycine betaine/proline transport system substrate-binding protein